MKSPTLDLRQTPGWGVFLSKIGWQVEKVGDIFVYVRTIPLLNVATIKIQHPFGPIPFGKIETIAKKYRALFVIIEPHHVGYDETAFLENNYQRSKMQFVNSSTLLIDLSQSEEKLFASFSESARRNIRKSQQHKMIIKVVDMKKGIQKEWFDHFYRLLKNLGKIKKFYVPSYDEYFKKMTAFKDTSYLLFAFAKENPKEPIAVVWYGSYKDILWYFQTGIAEKGYDLLANYLLVWEGLKIGKKRGMKTFDFETLYDPRYPTTNKKWKGYSEFKKRFHGTVVVYPPSWIKFYNPVFLIIYKIGTMFSKP